MLGFINEKDIPQLIRYNEVQQLTGLSRSQILFMVKCDQFPKPIKICGKRAVGWVQSEVVDWIKDSINNNRITG